MVDMPHANMMNTSTAGMPYMGNNGVMPMNMSLAQAKQVQERYLRLKDDGASEQDPEMQKLRGTLTQLSQNQKALREEYARRQASTQGQHIPNGNAAAVAANGINGATVNGVNPQSDASVALNLVKGGPAPRQAQNGFSPEQITTLRAQLHAFKWLSKGLPMPANIQQQLRLTAQSKRQSTPREENTIPSVETASDTPASTTVANASASSVDTTTRHWFDKFTDPRDSLTGHGVISFREHSRRHRRAMVPAIMPMGIDIDKLREQREIAIYNRIKNRLQELENLPANIGLQDPFSEEPAADKNDFQMQARIEYLKLSLLGRQRELRKKTAQQMLHFDSLAQTANRSLYRRTKKMTIHEARTTEKLEREQRSARETKEKRKQMEQINAIMQHCQELKQEGETQRHRSKTLAQKSLAYHQQIEKEEQKRIERTAKQRLQALKNDDEATYLKLLGQAKDSRITHLLSQTDGFLKQLANSVKAQQRSAVGQYGGEDEELPEEDIEDDEDDEDGGPKVDYYEIAHRIKETVSAQASILVGGTLKEYQVKGLQWMISLYNNNLNGILADEMGLGKTIQTISLITYLIEKKRQQGPYLVIVPLSTLTNWTLEFEKWAPSVQKIVYKGNPATRKQQQFQIRQGQFQVLLTTYEYIIKDRPVLSKIKWLSMIVDEGHRMKNPASKLSSTITQYYHTRYRLILTGTPLQNNLPELWALLNFVLPTIFKSVKSFDEWFNTPFANTGGQDRMDLTEEEQLLVIKRLHKVLRPFLLRRLKKDVEKDLPDKQERVVKCTFSALQAKLYKQLVTNSQLQVSDGKGGKTSMRGLSNMLMQLRKLCNHPFVFEQVEDSINPGKVNNDLLWRTAGKFELLDRVLPKFKATGHRVLMFFQMTQIMNIMEDFLRLRGLKYLRLDGATKADDRSDLLKLFNAPGSEYFCFLLSTRAGGLGLNLQTADTVIIYDSDWNPHQDLQAQDRAHRIGQKNEVRILRLISSDSVEENILERARFKLDMDGKVIQAGKFDNKSTNEERENLLRTLLDAAENADALKDQEGMEDDDLNEIMARSEEELVIFREMDKQRSRDDEYGPGKKLPRLMAEFELPDIYLNDDVPQEETVEEFVGRGARERTRVKYDDGLTEEQWLMAVDDDEDTIEDAIARKQARIDKRQTNKAKRERGTGADSSPDVSREASEEPQPKKGRNRKPVSVPKRKADEEIEEQPASKKKRGRFSKPIDTLSAADRNTINKVMSSVYQTLMDLTVDLPKESDDDDEDDDEEEETVRGVIDPFLKPVPKAAYPEYYLVIQNPIAMSDIEKKMKRNDYQNLKEFMADIRLLCNNARTFNDDGSLLYQDANLIEKTALDSLKAETSSLGAAWRDWDASGTGSNTPDEGLSTTGTGTPATQATGGNGTKLRLTYNGNSRGGREGGAQDDGDDI